MRTFSAPLCRRQRAHVGHCPLTDLFMEAVIRRIPITVTRIALRPWQQVVFWRLRIYIVVRLIVMAFGFDKVASS